MRTQEIEVLNILEKVKTEKVRNKKEAKNPYQGSATYLLYSTTAVT